MRGSRFHHGHMQSRGTVLPNRKGRTGFEVATVLQGHAYQSSRLSLVGPASSCLVSALPAMYSTCKRRSGPSYAIGSRWLHCWLVAGSAHFLPYCLQLLHPAKRPCGIDQSLQQEEGCYLRHGPYRCAYSRITLRHPRGEQHVPVRFFW